MRGRGGRGGGRGGYAGGRATGAAQLRSQLIDKSNSAKRLHKDYAELKNAKVPLVGVAACPSDTDFFYWIANIRGPEMSAFYGGVFHMYITFPKDYPCSPPSIELATEIPHPNVFGKRLCLDMLQPKSKNSSWYDGWTSAYTVEAVLIQLQSFLFEVPRIKRDFNDRGQADGSISGMTLNAATQQDPDNKYKKAVDLANAFKCQISRHRGPIEPYPPFNEKEADEDAFVLADDPKTILKEEFLCYHTRNKLPEVSLGIGVSLSRLPRTGEIRSVKPTLDLLSLRAFTKQKVRRSIENERFTHYLPLYFGESQPFDVTYTEQQKDQNGEIEFVEKTKRIDPRERLIQLLKHSISFLTKGNAHKEVTAEMVLEIMPKLIITHMAELANERKHISILAIRRLVNFIRLFRLCIELIPGVMPIINEKIRMFKEEEGKRVKDFTPSLGDILSMSIVSDQYNLNDFLEAYLEEQLDRQAFWIILQIPEIDHTDEKNKGKNISLEQNQEEACFKTGLAGFQITMLFFTLTKMIQEKYGGNWQTFEGAVDDNFGCLSLRNEDELQAKFKTIQKVDSFQKYYTFLGQGCPDSEALRTRLHKAIQNSKNKKYHGSSEHMNELPELKDQSKDYILADPSPFVHYNEASKTFLDGANPAWKQLCQEKFNWVRRQIEQGMNEVSPSQLAAINDENTIVDSKKRTLQLVQRQNQQPGYNEEISKESVFEEYPASFSWRDLYHKLCFEQMIANFDKILDFSVFYDYVNKIGSQQQVLCVKMIKKTALKSNHYWVMVLLNKLENMRVLKLVGNHATYVGQDFFKFLVKGMNYMAKQGRQFQKICINNLLGVTGNCGEYLYPFLKPNSDLLSIDFSSQTLQMEDAKAIGKVLADFRSIRELNLNNCQLNTNTTKEIADGLMRAKQLEILRLAGNSSMGQSLGTVIYNLAFSPKIRHIDVSETLKGTPEIAEAFYKLLKISGAIETLNMRNAGVAQHLKEPFFQALGENKTLKHLMVDAVTTISQSYQKLLGNAVAFNAYRNGALELLSVENWFRTRQGLWHFIDGLLISAKEHELWYGDKKLAGEMQKEDLLRHMYCNLKNLNIGNGALGNFGINYKTLKKQTKPEWPRLLELATKAPLTLNMKKTNLRAKDMETIAYMLADNPFGASKLVSLDMQMNKCIGKDGAKLLAPAIQTNNTLRFLNLDSCSIGVSGMKVLAESLKTNTSIKQLSLYRNIIDVDGARALGGALKTNTTLSFLDIGHNRIRMTGLKSIVEGILSNNGSVLNELCIKWNFITDEGLSYLFDSLILPKQGRTQQLKKVWIKNNFLSDFHKIELNKRLTAANMVGKVYVDDFEGVNLLAKEFIDRSIWIAPMPSSYMSQRDDLIAHFFQEQHKCGFVVDVRMGQGRAVPSRSRANHYCVVEYAHENSVPRSLKLASKKLAKFSGQPVRIYKAGTKTAVNFPSQRRRGY